MTTTATVVAPSRSPRPATLRRVVDRARWILTSIAGLWTAVGDAGQLGPAGDTVVSRHTGARI